MKWHLVALIATGIWAAGCGSTPERARPGSGLPPQAPTPAISLEGAWYDFVIASPGNRTQAGFLVPASPERLSLATILATGVYYSDSLERGHVLHARGVRTLLASSTLLCDNAELGSRFVDGRLFHEFDPSWPIDPADVLALQRGVFLGPKWALVARLVGQPPEGTAGFFLLGRNDRAKAPIGGELKVARYFHSIDEAIKMAGEHNASNRIYPADSAMLDGVWLEPFPRNQLPSTFRQSGDGRTP